ADETRAAVGVGDAVEFAQQTVDVAVGVAVSAAVACRIQAGCAIERVHAQPRIVRQRRQAGGAAGVARLEDRVLDEAQAGLFGVLDAELVLGADLETAAGEQRPEFLQLACVARGEHERPWRRVHRARASRWCWSKVAIPPSARPSSASSSSRRKAWPSAVPCSSMKPPPSFITTFMSVSQPASSA